MKPKTLGVAEGRRYDELKSFSKETLLLYTVIHSSHHMNNLRRLEIAYLSDKANEIAGQHNAITAKVGYSKNVKLVNKAIELHNKHTSLKKRIEKITERNGYS